MTAERTNLPFAIQSEVTSPAVGSTDRRNTRCKLFSWRLILQGLTGPLVELPGDGAEFGLGMNGKVRSARQILSEQPVGVFV